MVRTNFTLTNKILELSHSKIWSEAAKEWDCVDVYEVSTPESCLCGHFPIIEVCEIKNKITGATENVGNCCVKKFLGLRPDMIVKSIKKIKADITASVNPQTLDYALKQRCISRADYDFYMNIWRKRELSSAREKWKKDINNRIIHHIDLIKK